jgi:3-oxoacyl-[acyl-carrier-protein] synthase-3
MRVLEPKLKLRVLGRGTGLPDREPIDNVELLRRHPDTRDKPEAFLKGFAAKIESGFGQGRRRMIREPDQAPSLSEPTSEDLAIAACREALGPKGVPSAFVLGSTTSPRYTGSQAAAVLGKLGHRAPAFEVKAGCSTSQASLLYAYSLMKLGYPDVLVAATETLSKTVHPGVKETWFGFADGSGALWLGLDSPDAPGEALARFEVEKAVFSTDGEHVDLYTVPGRMPPLREEMEAGRYFISGDSAEMKVHALERYVRMIETILPTAADRKTIDWIVPHQVNLRLIEETTEKTGLQDVPVVWDSREHGNIGGASILFSLAKALAEKRFKPGDRVLLVSVGGGLNFGAQVLRFY